MLQAVGEDETFDISWHEFVWLDAMGLAMMSIAELSHSIVELHTVIFFAFPSSRKQSLFVVFVFSVGGSISVLILLSSPPYAEIADEDEDPAKRDCLVLDALSDEIVRLVPIFKEVLSSEFFLPVLGCFFSFSLSYPPKPPEESAEWLTFSIRFSGSLGLTPRSHFFTAPLQ